IALTAASLVACQDKAEPTTAAPLPIIDHQQLRYPAGHPQLKLLVTAEALPAKSVAVDLPARLVWDEEKTQRIYPAFAGRVSRITADVGQAVSPGQLLAQLASPEFGAAQADTQRAQAEAALARKALARQRELFEAGVVARKDLDVAEADSARAEAEVARAQARTSLYGSTAGVNQQLGLRSDIRGNVVERNINPGQEVRPDNANVPLFVVSDPSTLWVHIDAQEADARALRPGATVQLQVPVLGDQTFEARVAAVTDQIDPSTRTIKVRAVVNNPQRLLKSEMLARAHYERQVDASVEVPASAVFLRGNQQFVFVQSAPGAFEPRDVKLAHEGAQKVLISEGLKPGEQVVVQNGLLLARELRIARETAKGETVEQGPKQ
ncbi:MAG: hypothetical protein RL559_40, partial [Pseudomonadota bacterium]